MSAYPVLLTRPLLAGFAAGVLISLGACSAANPEAPTTEAGSPKLSDQAHKRERAELHEQLAAAPAELQRKSQVAGRAVMPSVAYAPMPMSVQADALPQGYRDENREQYQKLAGNPVHAVAETPVSTFSIDVDTGSYANVRRFLNGGQLPPQDAVRLEELVNYFPYAYPLPKGDVPFGVHTELAATPWNPESRLLRIAIKASDLRVDELPPANLVFLVDVSGSMDRRDGLPMVQSTLKLLVEQLRAQDKVSLVVYAGSSSVVLQPTFGSEKAKIRAAIDQLTAGGSTAGESGIQLAYQQAQQGFIDGGINRILLATDGEAAFTGEVEITEALGEVTLLYFKRQGEASQVIAKLPGIHPDLRHKTVRLAADPAKVHLFANGRSLLYR